MNLARFWEILPTLSSLKLKAQFDLGPTVLGTGNVVLIQEGQNVYLFKEQGSWLSADGKEIAFSNIYRFTLEKDKISLEQLSRGEKHPRFLFYLVEGEDSLVSIAPHMCNQDAYHVKVDLNQGNIQMQWEILGPKKNQKIEYSYQ